MASLVYTNGLEAVCNAHPWLTATVKIALVGTSTPYVPDVDHDFMSSVTASELSTTNYTGGYGGAGRKTLASKTLTVVDGSDRLEFSSAAPTWTAIGPSSGGPTVEAAVIVVETGGSDATARLISYEDFTNVTVNSGDLTVSPGTGGWFYIATA